MRLSSCRGQNCKVQAMFGDGGHAMSLIRNGFAVSCRRRGLLSALFSALLALALFDPGAATAQEAKQIKLTDKHIQGFMAASKDMGKLYAGANPDKPDPKLEARAAAIAKKNAEPPEQIRKEIAALKADKSVPEAEKKEDLAQLEASLKTAKPIQFKENIALVLKYFDQLAPLMQEQDSKRPAD